jgi:solute carrier family 25 carnitine/acylcarnitine transporter 20/29
VQQVDRSKHGDYFFTVARDQVKRGGVTALYRGVWITALRDLPSYGLYYYSYEVVRDFFRNKTNGQVGLAGQLIAGGIAGMLSWFPLYPVDVVKSRLQSQAFAKTGQELLYNGSIDCFRKSLKAEGWSVFTRGLGATMIRGGPCYTCR